MRARKFLLILAAAVALSLVRGLRKKQCAGNSAKKGIHPDKKEFLSRRKA